MEGRGRLYTSAIPRTGFLNSFISERGRSGKEACGRGGIVSTACECDDGEREEEETTTGPDDIEVSEWEGSWAGVRHLLLDN